MKSNQKAMEAITLTKTNRISTIRSSKWSVSAAAMLLSASLLLSACGDMSSQGTQQGTQPEVATPVAGDLAGTPVTGDLAVTPETDGQPTLSETESVTDTEGTDTEGVDSSGTITGTDDMTDTDAMTGTGATGTDTTTGDTSAMMGVAGAEGQYVRASDLLDYDFENIDGQVSGDLEDLLIDFSTGQILFAAIEYGGVLDLGDKDIVVPMNAFTIGEEGELVLNIDENRLENYPDVGNNWPDLNDPAWDDDVWNFWNEAGVSPGVNFDQATTTVARASEVIGNQVADLGVGAGSVLDILVNLGSASANYLIVDHGEGLDTDPYIIPVAAFDMTNREAGLNYGADFTPDLLENAPRFNLETYPQGTPLDNDFGDQIESAWNDLGFSNDLNRDGEND
jgi:sporulation protein YlmC with PRC-barrel domain